jgi:hypothetical protein
MIEEDLRKKKLAELFVSAKKVGYSDDQLRDIAEIQTGKRSLRSLNSDQLKSIISTIKKAHPSSFRFQKKRKEKVLSIPKNAPIDTLRTPDQIEYSNSLSEVVRKTTDYKDLTLDSISFRMFKKPFLKLSRHEDQSIIEALKKILIRFHQSHFDSILLIKNNKNLAFAQLVKDLTAEKGSCQE